MDQATDLRRMVKIESSKVHHLKKRRDKFASGKNRPKVITVSSGKGGVGKTNVTVNLAIACQRMKQKVLIFDADLGLANIDILFGLNPQHNIDEIIKEGKELSQIIIDGPEGVAIIPASSGIQDLTHLTEGQKINLLNEFDNLNNKFDILLIDTAAGISSNVVYFNLAAEDRIVVVTPEPTSVTDAYALIKVMFQEHGVNHFDLLMNMVENEREAMSVFKNLSNVIEKFMRGVSVDYAGFIQRDDHLQMAVNQRRPVLCAYPETVSSKCFNTLATYLIEQMGKRPIDGNIKFFWKRLMTGSWD